MRRAFARAIFVFVSIAIVAGCAGRVSFIEQGKEESPYRWKVEKVNYSRLSKDQQALVSAKGNPDYIRFYRPLQKREGGFLVRLVRYAGGGLKNLFVNSLRPTDSFRKIEGWVYLKEGTITWFQDGKKVSYVVAEE